MAIFSYWHTLILSIKKFCIVKRHHNIFSIFLFIPIFAFTQVDCLPSWNEGAIKQAILSYVARVTTYNSPDFIPLPERIAVFDNDGTLWSEQAIYNQFAFALEWVRKMAPQHPEWNNTQPFKAVIERDHKALAASVQQGLARLILSTHTGMSTDEFAGHVSSWIKSTRYPRFNRPYTDMGYQPMLELLEYLACKRL